MHVSYSLSFFICEVANQTPVWLILCSQISVQVCWSHLLWGGVSALRLGQWLESLLIHDGFCTGPLFWLWWPRGVKKMSCASCSARYGQAHTRTLWGQTSALCCIQCPHSPLQQQHRPATCQARCPHTAPDTVAATRLNSVCFIGEMGEAEQVSRLCRGHPSAGTIATPP